MPGDENKMWINAFNSAIISVLRKFLPLQDCPTYLLQILILHLLIGWYTKVTSTPLQQPWQRSANQSKVSDTTMPASHLKPSLLLRRISCGDAFCKDKLLLQSPASLGFPSSATLPVLPFASVLRRLKGRAGIIHFSYTEKNAAMTKIICNVSVWYFLNTKHFKFIISYILNNVITYNYYYCFS